jgi:hypothetical protein
MTNIADIVIAVMHVTNEDLKKIRKWARLHNAVVNVALISRAAGYGGTVTIPSRWDRARDIEIAIAQEFREKFPRALKRYWCI